MSHGFLADLLRCPDHPEASLEPHEQGWTCSACEHTYSQRDGLIDLLSPNSLFPPEFRERETAQWDAQAEAYELERTRDEIYMACIRATARALHPRPGELILDAGCGTGLTMRQYWQTGMQAVAMDLSSASLSVCRRQGPPVGVLPVRGDLTQLPFADGVFDRAICANAIQQIPHTGLRQRAFAELARVVKPGGRVVISVHNFSRAKQKAGWKRENNRAGSPSGEIQYIYRHDAAELRERLSPHFEIESIGGAGVPLPYRMGLSPLSRWVERMLQRSRYAAIHGHMLIATCRRPLRSVAATIPAADSAKLHQLV